MVYTSPILMYGRLTLVIIGANIDIIFQETKVLTTKTCQYPQITVNLQRTLSGKKIELENYKHLLYKRL